MYSAYCRQSAVMLYFFKATGRTLWHGSSIDTRNDLKISTCGLVDDDCVDAAFEVMVPPESGGSRSSGLGVGAALGRIALEFSDWGVLRLLRSDSIVESDPQVLV